MLIMGNYRVGCDQFGWYIEKTEDPEEGTSFEECRMFMVHRCLEKLQEARLLCEENYQDAVF